jgi:hypothetical protein
MSIIEDLQKSLLNQSKDFLDELVNRRNSGQGYEDAFLDLLADRIRKNLPGHNMIISVRFKKMIAPFTIKPKDMLGIAQEKIRERICWPTWLGHECKSRICFGGEFSKGIEVDALIIRPNADFCFIEYENQRTELCNNFMKMYWLRQLLNRDFESLFVTTLTSRKGEGTYVGFKTYINRMEPLLNRLLKNWKILEIIDLFSPKKRCIDWEPM